MLSGNSECDSVARDAFILGEFIALVPEIFCVDVAGRTFSGVVWEAGKGDEMAEGADIIGWVDEPAKSWSKHFKKYVVFKFLLVFSVTSFKIDQNKNQNRSIGKVQNLGKRENINIQRFSPRCRSLQYLLSKLCGEFFTQMYYIWYQTFFGYFTKFSWNQDSVCKHGRVKKNPRAVRTLLGVGVGGRQIALLCVIW